MRRAIQKSNPFYDTPRFAFGFEHITHGVRLLDYGCFDGQFGLTLMKHKNVDYYGVDKNVDIVRQLNQRLKVSEMRDKIPFEDSFFDVVTIFEVLEHVHDQDLVLAEIRRVLKPSGMLLASVPRKNLFSSLDPANFKFIFPRLHHVFYRLKYSEEQYVYRYLNNPNGLIGDVEKEKAWHQHFREIELVGLVERNGFEVFDLDGEGLLASLFNFTGLVLGPLKSVFTQRLRNWDSYTFRHRGLLCAARSTKQLDPS